MGTIKGLGRLEGHSIAEVADLLLKRLPAEFSGERVKSYIRGKCILVTGAGGSIGSELCRQLIALQPGRIILFDIYENTTYELFRELQTEYDLETELIIEIGSIRDTNKVSRVFSKYHPHVVFHAAAHKHVPLMEANPEEAVLNNIFGTLNVAKYAQDNAAESFVLISTDKAVNPTSVMGATKRICELLVQDLDPLGTTVFSAVRFGNVLGSHGSVLPLFLSQLRRGKNLTVTDKEITRYFMSIREAARLVIMAGAYAEGGEIFILDMGNPVRVYEMAGNLLALCGYEQEEFPIQIVGLRPGEKLYEELFSDSEKSISTPCESITVLKDENLTNGRVLDNIHEFKDAIDGGSHQIKMLLSEFIPSYTPYMEKGL